MAFMLYSNFLQISAIFGVLKTPSGSLIVEAPSNLSSFSNSAIITKNESLHSVQENLEDISLVLRYMFPTIGTFALISNVFIIYSAKRGTKMTAGHLYLTVVAIIDISITIVGDLGIGLELQSLNNK